MHFYESGQLKQSKLSKDYMIGDTVFPSRSVVFLRNDGSVHRSWLSKDEVIQDIICKGGVGKIETAFHDNGRLASCFLPDDSSIQGAPCSGSAFHPVMFHPSGRLSQCTLSEDTDIQGHHLLKGARLRFDDDGKLLP